MITTRRTAVSDKEFESKLNTRIETDPNTDTSAFVDIAPVRVNQPEISERFMPAADKEDIMPTIKSSRKKEKKGERFAAEEISEVKSDNEASKSVTVDSKTKAIMLTYMAVAFVLAMIVLATGIMIGSRSVEVAGLENNVRQAYNRILGQEDTISYLNDELVVSAKADALGMTSANGGETIELLQLKDSVTYEERTNGFDAFCDFISKLIGG